MSHKKSWLVFLAILLTAFVALMFWMESFIGVYSIPIGLIIFAISTPPVLRDYKEGKRKDDERMRNERITARRNRGN